MARTYTNSEFEDILIYFTNSILGQNTEEEIAWDLAKNCISKLGFEDCVVYFVDEHNELLVQKAAYGPKNPQEFEISDPIFIPIGKGITGSAAKHARSELIHDTSLDERYIVDDKRRFSEITVPVIVDGKVFGVIDCEHSEKNFFTRQHLKILEAIASIYAVKISKVRAERAAREKEQHLLSIQKELLALKIQALRTQMNPHFLFNAINSIQFFITTGERKYALLYLTTLSRLIRYYLGNFEQDTVSIGEELNLMRHYLDLQSMRYTGKFGYKFHSAVSDYEAAMKIPNMILGSFTEHVLENAVFDNEGSGSVKIKIAVQNGNLKVTALYTSAAGNAKNRLMNYRQNMATWEEQVDLLNRLKGFGIKKRKHLRHLAAKGLSIKKVQISLPITD
ncbi:GAF domain-containing protein [Anseongella ginsenosidimutans]|uniref:GAF domain-containing protein n=1 Tax=Anseongella ginsenosidimutans TaxID=496056 RepID=A0A4R3KN69_9SPHI|nr:histidine kinase [Anseongella ginsenosidimutans]QEC52684.1 GAF domain-containing protein [Anseongella ginsenosidimutans]TCS85432.1 GAF domain-containing protein [Anseongella ginsenosidimutans]